MADQHNPFTLRALACLQAGESPAQVKRTLRTLGLDRRTIAQSVKGAARLLTNKGASL